MMVMAMVGVFMNADDVPEVHKPACGLRWPLYQVELSGNEVFIGVSVQTLEGPLAEMLHAMEPATAFAIVTNGWHLSDETTRAVLKELNDVGVECTIRDLREVVNFSPEDSWGRVP